MSNLPEHYHLIMFISHLLGHALDKFLKETQPHQQDISRHAAVIAQDLAVLTAAGQDTLAHLCKKPGLSGEP